MAVVTNEDKELISEFGLAAYTVSVVATYRERIEARIDRENAAYVATLQSEVDRLCRELNVERLTCKDAYNRILSFKEALANEQAIASAHNKVRIDEVNARDKRIAELEAQLAAAKPTLTSEEAVLLELVEKNWPQVVPVLGVCNVLRRYVVVPPKALTDDDLVSILNCTKGSGKDDDKKIRSVMQALRGRIAK